MAENFTGKVGYGQVEPNHLSAMRTGQIYAQLPCSGSITELENGQFLKYNYGAAVCNLSTASGSGEWLLHMSEVKLYEPRQFAADFRLTAAETSDGKIYPRLYKTNVGDIITTNQIAASGSVTVGTTIYCVNASGILEVTAAPAAGAMAWMLVDVTTMPDGKAAVKLQRIV